MSLIVTDAIVLHSRNYLESSRILRLATRDAGLQSVIARGARASSKRFGRALDLFAEGQAQIQVKAGRELNTLTSFDVTSSFSTHAASVDRFISASALAECVLRLVHDESAPDLFEGIQAGFRDIAQSEPSAAVTVTLAALWRLVAQVGFEPSLLQCAECHSEVTASAEALFSHRAGGVLCARCESGIPDGRRIPADARASIQGWVEGDEKRAGQRIVTPLEAKAHQRLLREFLSQHIPDSRTMKAFAVWESESWEPGVS